MTIAAYCQSSNRVSLNYLDGLDRQYTLNPMQNYYINKVTFYYINQRFYVAYWLFNPKMLGKIHLPSQQVYQNLKWRTIREKEQKYTIQVTNKK